jgi:hypothetical protein
MNQMFWIRYGDKLETNAELAVRVFGIARVKRQAKEIPSTGCSMITVKEKCYRDYCQNASGRLKAVLQVDRVQRTGGTHRLSLASEDSRVLIEVYPYWKKRSTKERYHDEVIWRSR